MNTPTTILLVDDDIRNLQVLEAILESQDYRLIKAVGADETLMTLMHEDCAAIVMDVKMPGMSGIELAQLIKQRKKTQHIPILFLTAHYFQDEEIVLGYGAGAVDYLTKPVNPDILRSKIAVFVDLFRKTAALAELNRAMEAEIQDRKHAEERFRHVVESAPHGMIVVGQDDRIALVNSRMEEIFGFHREELLGQTLETLVPQGLPASKQERMGAGAKKFCGEFSGRRKDGTSIPIEAFFSHYESGDELFLLISFVDITQRKQNEEALRESYEQRLHAEAGRAEAEAANSAKDRFLAMLSHELRTPLSPVLHAVALIEEENDCPPEMLELLEIIKRNVQLEARLIDDLLDLARIRNNKLQLQLEWVDVHDLLRRALQICDPDIRHQHLDVRLDLRAMNSVMEVDSARIQQIFWNLISNAVKYSGSGAKVSIATSDEEKTGFFRLEISDTGIGIEPERLSGIFNAFVQAHGDRSKGLGLGLSISQVLTELHGGTIEARSAGSGKGSVFTVRLPRPAQIPGKTYSGAQADRSTDSSLRILLVEDHADTLRGLERLLRSKGHKVISAGTFRDASKAMGESAFDLLLSDIGLPDGRGLDLMDLFVKAAENRPVAGIALSGFGTPEDIKKSHAAGFRNHLTKPVEFSNLQKCLSEISGIVNQTCDHVG